MKRIFSKSKLKAAAAEAAASSSGPIPGYQLKEKDLPKLHKAAWTGDLAKIQQLSKKNDVFTLDKQNRTPLHLACAKGHVNLVNFLTVNSQSSKLNLCDNDQRSALMKACQGDFDECAEILLNHKADPNLVDKDGNTALHLAADSGFVHVAILLLNNGSMATPTNKTGSTPLHLAVVGKHDEMVEILLEGNADVNATDNDNRTALMLACQADQIGMVKMLLENKADTDIKDSKGWTANDHAIMGGFHGCSHLIDEFNASRRPKASVSRPSSAGLFGSTTGSDALGFSLGGPAVDNFDDDEEDDMSYGKGSVVDSWASEPEEVPKPKPKVNNPVKLNMFVHESDNESIRSGVSARSSGSRSKIPQSVSRQGSITSERSLQSAKRSSSGSKLPRPGSASSNRSNRQPDSKRKKPGEAGGMSKRKDSWGDSEPPTPRDSIPPTPRDSIPPTPRDSIPPTPRSGKGVTSQDNFMPTPRGSILSARDTGSEWDDDDVLDALEDTLTKKSTKAPEKENFTPRQGAGMQREAPATDQRKAVLEGLGMSDVDDESSVAFSDDDIDIGDKPSTVKRNQQASGDHVGANEQNNNNKTSQGQMPPPQDDEEDDDSEWDSDGDDLLPSESDNKGPPVIRPGALSRYDDSEDDASIPPTPSPQPPTAEAQGQPIDDIDVKTQLSMVEESPEDQTDGRKGRPRRDSKQVEHDDEDEWDSEDEDLEEESEWERERGGTKDALEEEQKNSGNFDELNRQQQWEEEEKQRQEKQRQEAEEELQREKEELERERRQQEAERQQLDKERAAEKRRQEEQAAEDRRHRAEEEKVEVARKEAERKQLEQELAAEKRRQEEQAAKDRKRIEEEEAEVARKKAKIEAELQHLEEVRRQEEERIQAEREQLEEEKRREEEKRDAEQRRLEEQRRKEEERLDAERRKLEEEKQQTALQRDEKQRDREEAIKEEERRIEAERKKLEEQRQQVEEKLEEAKRQENLEKEQELQNQEKERRRLEEDRKRIEEEKKQLEQERTLEEERKKMEEERRKREEERLDAERRRHEEMRRQFEEDQLRMTQELKDEDEIRKVMERKHLEDERQRLEEQRLEAEKRERQMEEQRMEEKRQLLSTQKEMEEMRRKMEDEKAQFEKQLRETAEKQANDAVKKEFEEKLQQEQVRIKAEKERMEAENREIEKKRLEIEAMQKDFENKTQERQLERYKESIEKRLADEDRSVNGVDDDNESLDEISKDLEAAVLQRQQIESGTYNFNPGNTPGGRNTTSGVQSLANTGDFSVASLSQGNPVSPMKGGAPVPRQSPAAAVPTNATSPTKALYNSPMLRSSTGPNNAVPTWHSILTEPDGLDYTSSEGEEEMMATQAGLHSSMLSPHQGGSNTLLGSPGSPMPSTNDPTAVIRLQSMVREQKRATERERNERLNANNQCKILQGEKAELNRRLEDVTKFKMSLDQQLLDLEAKIRGLEHELSQELERRHNSEVLLQKTREQLKRKEELYAAEIEAKQKTELASRNVQMDLRSSQNVVKQLEEERNELRRQLNQEKAARAIQEDLVNDHRRTHEVMQEESTRVYTEKAEAVNRLEAADESRKAALNQSDKLKTELHALKLELEKQKVRHRDDQGLLVSENEELAGKIEELKSEMRVAEEALAHATMTYNAQLAAVRTENAVLHNGMEKEKHSKDQLKAELDSVQKRLDATGKDLEKAENARSELAHTLQRESDEWSRARDRLEHENATMKDSSQTAAQRLGAAESKVASLENELQAANTSLMEQSNQLAAIQRDLDMKSSVQNSHDSFLHKEREDNVKLSARVEALTERYTEAQTEIGSLKRALDAAQHHTVFKDKDAQNAQDKFNNTLTSLQAENDRTRTIWEERNNSLQESISRLKEELQRSEHNSSLKDQDMRKLQQELTDSLLKVSITENQLEMAKKAQTDLEKDKRGNRDQVKRLTDKVLSVEKERRTLETRVEELQNQLVHAERSNLDTSHQLMATQTTLQRKSDLEDTIRQLEKENSRLEISMKHEAERSRDLSRKLDESQKMCSGLETIVTNIKTSQLVMEDKLSDATAARSMFAREVDDHKQLWESEVKSRSKLGLRIAQLERARAEIQAQVDEEKKRTRKMAELKRSAEDKLQNEVQKVHQLEQEITTLKAKVKLAKKKLKEQGPPELRLSTMQTEFERERLNMESAMGTLRRQLEDVNQQLDRESMLRLNLEKSNRQLQQDLTSTATSEKTKDKLERKKQKLEDELSQMKRAMENGYIEKGQMERYRQDIDAKARMEINEKLEQVNAYLEEQSQAREKLEQLRLSNEAEVRKELEDTIDDLKHQLSRLRNGYHDAQTRKDTMEAETSKLKEMYNQEVQRREKLSADLEKNQDKLLEAQAKLNFERQRIHHIREGSFNRDIPAAMSPVKSTDPPPVDSIAEKVWSELDRSISRHLKAGPTDTGPNLTEYNSDRLSNGYGATPPRGPDNSYMATLRKNYFV